MKKLGEVLGVGVLLTFWWVPGVIAGLWDFPVGFALMVVLTFITYLMMNEYNKKVYKESIEIGAVFFIGFMSVVINLVVFFISLGTIDTFGSKTYLPDEKKLYNIEKYVDAKHSIVTDDNILQLSGEEYFRLKSEKCIKIVEIKRKYYNQIVSINSRKGHSGEPPKYVCMMEGELK